MIMNTLSIQILYRNTMKSNTYLWIPAVFVVVSCKFSINSKITKKS